METPLINDFLAGDVPASALPDPKWGPNGKLVYDRTYSRPLFERVPGTEDYDTTKPKPWKIGDNEGRLSEVWAETVRRVVLGNTSLSPETLVDGEVDELFRAIFEMRIIPGGRHLWVDGTGLPYSRNCWAAPMGRRTAGHFKFLGSRLFEGGGVGANYSNDMIAKTTPIKRTIKVLITCREDHPDIDAITASANGNWVPLDKVPTALGTVVTATEDCREGWVDAWVKTVDTACSVEGPSILVFDLSYVRPAGSELVTYGGTASGPEPLAGSLVAFEHILNGAVGRRLSSLETMTLDHEIAAAVVAGGTRRSARLATKHWADHDIFEFIGCKLDDSMHWSTNISVETDDAFYAALDDKMNPMYNHATMVLNAVAMGMAVNGEPGLLNTTQMSIGEKTTVRTTNPCGEVPLETEGDEFGEACNIGSVNLDAVRTDDELARRSFWLLGRFLYRSTLKPYPGADANTIENRNRRIGAGLMGLQEWALAHGTRLSEASANPDLTKKMVSFREAVREGADSLADALGTPRSIKVTAVAPNGSTAKLPGVGPGTHPVLAKFAEQRIRFSIHDKMVDEMRAKGYPVEPCVYAPTSTVVVTVPTRDIIMDKGFDKHLIEQADEITLSEFLRLQAWVTDTFCSGTDGNAVSATASIPADSNPVEIAAVLKEMGRRLKGTTVFPSKSRPQQPVTIITEEEYESLLMFCEAMSGQLADDCSTGACPIR